MYFAVLIADNGRYTSRLERCKPETKEKPAGHTLTVWFLTRH